MKRKILINLVIGLFCLSAAEAQSIRKNYREFTAQEVADYNNALQTLWQQGVVTELANHHGAHFRTVIHTTSPIVQNNGSQFLTWHRFFMLDYEYMLRGTTTANNYLTVPYWDWPNDNVANNPLFWDNYFLLRSNFVSWGVTRVNNNSIATLPSQTDINNTLALPNLFGLNDDISTAPDFSHRLEYHHNRVHSWVGGTTGTMSDTISPLDPIFYLHHNMVDQVWQRWEDASSGIQSNLGSFNNTGLIHWSNILNNQLFDSRSIPRPPSAGSSGRKFDVWYARNGTVILDGANGTSFSADDVTSPYVYRYTAAVTHGGSTVTGKICVGDVQYDASNNIIADNKGGFSVENGVTCHFRAGGTIDFKPGFIAKAGCEMTAKIIAAANNMRTRNGEEEDLKYDIHPILIDYDHCSDKLIGRVEKTHISISPNPAKASLTLSFVSETNIKNAVLTITDILGRVYRKQNMGFDIGRNNKTININDLKSGTYVLNIFFADGKTEQIKFIKQ